MTAMDPTQQLLLIVVLKFFVRTLHERDSQFMMLLLSALTWARLGSGMGEEGSVRRWWVKPRPCLYFENYVECYPEDEFKNEMRVGRDLFDYLCAVVGPFMVKEDTKFRKAIPVRRKVAMALKRLGTGMGYRELAQWFGHGMSTIQECTVEFCQVVVSRLEPLFVTWPTEEQFRVCEQGFEAMHGIPHIAGAIDGSHIHIDPPKKNRAEFFCRKRYYSVVLQAICDPDGYIWDYHCGWAGSMHDFNVFSRVPASKRIARGELRGRMLLGDAAYPARDYMLPPYKTTQGRPLMPHEKEFKYRQSATRMPIEGTFGRLKGRFRILINKVPGDLKTVPTLVGACVVLHNLCHVFKDEFHGWWLVGWEDHARHRAEEAFLKEHMSDTVRRLMERDVSISGDPSESAPLSEVDMDGSLHSAVMYRENLPENSGMKGIPMRLSVLWNDSCDLCMLTRLGKYPLKPAWLHSTSAPVLGATRLGRVYPGCLVFLCTQGVHQWYFQGSSTSLCSPAGADA